MTRAVITFLHFLLIAISNGQTLFELVPTHSAESLHTTLANLELGLRLHPKLALNPVLYHHGGSIESRQSNGPATFSTSDQTGYDVHTARASLLFSPNPSSAISTSFIIGSENTWSTNLAYRLRF